MPDAQEVELKLELSPEDLNALRAHPSIERFRVGRARTQRLRSIYFDSASESLARAGISLRIRSSDAGRVQTVKCGERVAAGLFERREHEVEIASDAPALELVEAPLRAIVDVALGGEPANPIFETDMERVVIDQRDGETEWELAFDRGHVIAGSRRVAISEVELELKCGSVDRIFAEALAWLDSVPMIPGGLSKAARGYALLHGKRPELDIGSELANAARALGDASHAGSDSALGFRLQELAREAARGDASARRVRSARETAECLLRAGRILAAR